MRFFLACVCAAMLFACAVGTSPASQPSSEPTSPTGPIHKVIIVSADDLDHFAVFPNEDSARAWCFKHQLRCKGIELELK